VGEKTVETTGRINDMAEKNYRRDLLYERAIFRRIASTSRRTIAMDD